MAKIKISFNNTNYSIDESAISSASDSLKSHLSTTMSGSGATINFGGTSYNVDSAKLLAATNDFISHLGIVAGNGYKVIVNGTEYSVGSDKVAGAVSELEIVLGNLHTDEGDSGESGGEQITAGLYETGSNYTVLLKDWDTLLAEGVVHVDNGVVTTNMDTNTWVNSSADILVGDLMLPSDGSVTKLGESAFDTCTNLTGVVIPDSVTTIEAYAFYYCESLTSINIPSSVINFGERICEGTGAFNAVIEDGATTVKHGVFTESGVASVVIPDSITTIEGAAFCDCNNLTSVKISNRVTIIENSAFARCKNLTSVVIPDSVTTIELAAFKDCTNLSSVEFGNGLTTIEGSAFARCENLERVTFPNSITIIDQKAFSGCTKLSSIYFNGTVEEWDAIRLMVNWNLNVPATEVVCSDGTVAL